MKKLLALYFAVLFLPITILGQGEQYNLSLGDYRNQRYNTLDTNTPNYTIVRGDNLWDLAIRHYGIGQEWRYIWEHNRYIKDPHWIYPGDPLFIPGMPQANILQTNAPQINMPQPLPMWTDTPQTLRLEFADIFDEIVGMQQTAPPDTITAAIDIIEQEPDTIPEPPAPPKKPEGTKKRYFVMSMRGEALVPYDLAGVGGAFELGAISGNGFYFSMDLNGGKLYYGGGFDIGGCLGKDKGAKSVIGIFGGYWTFMNSMEVIKNGTIVGAAEGKNMSYGGGFWKLMFGRTFNIDITNKCFVVLKDEPTGWDSEKGKFTYDKGIKPMWSGSAGFTFTVKKKRLGR